MQARWRRGSRRRTRATPRLQAAPLRWHSTIRTARRSTTRYRDPAGQVSHVAVDAERAYDEVHHISAEVHQMSAEVHRLAVEVAKCPAEVAKYSDEVDAFTAEVVAVTAEVETRNGNLHHAHSRSARGSH